MATHSSVLAWRIPGTGESGGLPSMGSHRVGHDWSDLAAAAAYTFVCMLGCIWLCNPVDSRPPGSSVHEILQDRLLEWVANSSFRGSSQPRVWTCVFYVSCTGRQILYIEPPGKSICIYMCVLSHVSCVQFFVTLWTVALQAPQSMGFSRKSTGMGGQILQVIFLIQDRTQVIYIYIYIYLYCDWAPSSPWLD